MVQKALTSRHGEYSMFFKLLPIDGRPSHLAKVPPTFQENLGQKRQKSKSKPVN